MTGSSWRGLVNPKLLGANLLSALGLGLQQTRPSSSILEGAPFVTSCCGWVDWVNTGQSGHFCTGQSGGGGQDGVIEFDPVESNDEQGFDAATAAAFIAAALAAFASIASRCCCWKSKASQLQPCGNDAAAFPVPSNCRVTEPIFSSINIPITIPTNRNVHLL